MDDLFSVIFSFVGYNAIQHGLVSGGNCYSKKPPSLSSASS